MKLIAVVLLMLIPYQLFGYVDLIKETRPVITQDRAEDLDYLVRKYSKKHGVPSEISISVMWQESGFANGYSNVDFNPCSAGYMQILSTTGNMLAGRTITCSELITNYEKNIEMGIRYLSMKYEESGHWAGAIGLYNGINNLEYVKGVLDKWEKVMEYIND